MPRPFNPKLAFKKRRSHEPQRDRPRQNTGGRFDSPADEPLGVPSLALQTPFTFDAALAGRILRRDVNAKEAITVKDASGAFFRASVKELSATGGTAVPYERLAVSPEPTIELTLACAVLARQRMIFVVQKATELGVTRIVPLLTDHSVPHTLLVHEKAYAWPGQITRAAKQCRRSSLPELAPPMPLDHFLVSPLAQADLSLNLDNVGGSAPPPDVQPRRVLLLVGPEGGFSDAERAKLEGKTHAWILGGRVLRAETAVLVGLAAAHLNWGDFRPAT